MTQPPKLSDDKTTEGKPSKSLLPGIVLFHKGVVLGEKLGHLFKLLTPIAVIFGVYLISDFTRRAGVPFPPFDGSLLIFLAIIVIALIGLAYAVICIPLLPLITVADKSVREYLRPCDFHNPPNREEQWRYLKKYISLFLPFLLGFISWPMIIVVGTSIDAHLGTNPEIFLHLSFYSIALIFSIIAFCLGVGNSYYMQQTSIVRSNGDIRNLRSFLGTAIFSSLLSYIWSSGTLVFILALGLHRQLISDDFRRMGSANSGCADNSVACSSYHFDRLGIVECNMVRNHRLRPVSPNTVVRGGVLSNRPPPAQSRRRNANFNGRASC